jgi:hypothetical protein
MYIENYPPLHVSLVLVHSEPSLLNVSQFLAHPADSEIVQARTP